MKSKSNPYELFVPLQPSADSRQPSPFPAQRSGTMPNAGFTREQFLNRLQKTPLQLTKQQSFVQSKYSGKIDCSSIGEIGSPSNPSRGSSPMRFTQRNFHMEKFAGTLATIEIPRSPACAEECTPTSPGILNLSEF